MKHPEQCQGQRQSTRFSQFFTVRGLLTSIILGTTLVVGGCGGDGDSSSGGGAVATAANATANDSATCTAAALINDPCTVESDAAVPATAPAPQPAIVGPNLGGDNWAGYFKDREGAYEGLTAEITHVGDIVTIRTSKSSGVARLLSGRITSSGKMLLYDQFDLEDWTTLFGPASTNSINLADFVKSGSETVNTNILILKRGAQGAALMRFARNAGTSGS